MRLVIALALGAVALSAQAPTRQTPAQPPPRDIRARPSRPSPDVAAAAAIRGRVVADGSDVAVPIVKARVALSGAGTVVDSMFTDTEGRFEFSGLPDGRYTLVAEKTGFARTRYGARYRSDPPLPIDVAAGRVEQIEIRMPRGAALSGRVVDNLGDPVVGAPVRAHVLQIQGTDREFVTASQVPVDTDDLGEFRIGGLAAGRYYVSVAPRDLALISLPSWGRRIGLGRTFYPSGTTSAGATPIDLRAGEERAGVDLTLEPFRPAELSVTISGGPEESATAAGGPGLAQAIRAAVSSVSFVPGGELGVQRGELMNIDGSGFSMRGAGSSMPVVTIHPGDWVVVSRQPDRHGAIAHVSLGPGEVAGLTLALRPPARFSGRILFQGSVRRPAPTTVHIDVIGSGPDTNISPLLLAPGGPFTPKPDGTFELTGILGTVEFLIVPPPGWVVTRMTTGDRDLLDVPVTFLGGETIGGVEVVLTDQVAELRGSVFDGESRPYPGCAVVVYQAGNDAGFNPNRMLVERADQRAEFRIPGLPPGEYLLLARPDFDIDGMVGAGAFERFRQDSVAFTVQGRETKTIALPCTRQR